MAMRLETPVRGDDTDAELTAAVASATRGVGSRDPTIDGGAEPPVATDDVETTLLRDESIIGFDVVTRSMGARWRRSGCRDVSGARSGDDGIKPKGSLPAEPADRIERVELFKPLPGLRGGARGLV